FGHGNSEVIQSESERLTVKVAARNDNIFIDKNIRVIGNRINLCFEGSAYKFDSVFSGSMYLRHTSERIRILHVFFFLSDDFASFQKFGNLFSGFHLSAMRASQVNQRIEGL